MSARGHAWDAYDAATADATRAAVERAVVLAFAEVVEEKLARLMTIAQNADRSGAASLAVGIARLELRQTAEGWMAE